jgi:hypothetical protein
MYVPLNNTNARNAYASSINLHMRVYLYDPLNLTLSPKGRGDLINFPLPWYESYGSYLDRFDRFDKLTASKLATGGKG